MRADERGMITKELTKAQAALERAFRMIANSGDLDLARSLREHGKAVGMAITQVNGGPVTITGAELTIGGS
jgi:hypothetical protein